jgi:hypothetical protein
LLSGSKIAFCKMNMTMPTLQVILWWLVLLPITASRNSTETQDLVMTTKIVVVTLDGVEHAHASNHGRLQQLFSSWREVCGQVAEFQVCPGVADPTRGHGVTKAFIRCLNKVLEDPVEVLVVLEDDARIFETAAEFCTVQGLRKLADSFPSDTLVGLLGGHRFSVREIDNVSKFQGRHIVPLKMSYGAFSWVIRRSKIPFVTEQFESDLRRGGKLAPDIALYRAADSHKLRVYGISPLVFWHEGGYSNTHKRKRLDIKGTDIYSASLFYSFTGMQRRDRPSVFVWAYRHPIPSTARLQEVEPVNIVCATYKCHNSSVGRQVVIPKTADLLHSTFHPFLAQLDVFKSRLSEHYERCLQQLAVLSLMCTTPQAVVLDPLYHRHSGSPSGMPSNYIILGNGTVVCGGAVTSCQDLGPFVMQPLMRQLFNFAHSTSSLQDGCDASKFILTPLHSIDLSVMFTTQRLGLS